MEIYPTTVIMLVTKKLFFLSKFNGEALDDNSEHIIRAWLL